MPVIEGAALRALLPHAGAMCLLDHVQRWDENSINCVADSHRSAQNPLLRLGRLSSVCGIEYAAQAMALHGALTSAAPGAAAGAAARVGLLAGVRDVRLHVTRLDDIESDLFCEVTHVAGDNLTALYEFALRDKDNALLTGRASVVLDAGTRIRL